MSGGKGGGGACPSTAKTSLPSRGGGGGLRSRRALERLAARAVRSSSGARPSLCAASAQTVGTAATSESMAQQHNHGRTGHRSIVARVGFPVASGWYAGLAFLSRLDRSSPQPCCPWARLIWNLNGARMTSL